VFIVVMDIVNPLYPEVLAGLVCEITESIHVVAVFFVADVLRINDPFGVLRSAQIEQLELGVHKNISIGWRQEICAGRIKRLFPNALNVYVERGFFPLFL
jgi:hypothetical protein